MKSKPRTSQLLTCQLCGRRCRFLISKNVNGMFRRVGECCAGK